jgi:hypothetical protein
MTQQQHAVPRTQLSPARLTANAANAQHSTGPLTPEGKARVAQNALKHGLFSRNVVGLRIPEPERQVEFAELLQELLEDFEPADRLETEFVHRLAALIWRVADLQGAVQLSLASTQPGELFCSEGIRSADALGKMEARLSRELSKAFRDLTFLQRYKLDFAERVNAHQHRQMKRAMERFDTETRLEDEVLQRAPYDGDEEFDDEIEFDDRDDTFAPEAIQEQPVEEPARSEEDEVAGDEHAAVNIVPEEPLAGEKPIAEQWPEHDSQKQTQVLFIKAPPGCYFFSE